METNLPTPMTARVYVNLPEGIPIFMSRQLSETHMSSLRATEQPGLIAGGDLRDSRTMV